MRPQKSKYLSDQKAADKARGSLWCSVHHTKYSSSVLTESSKTNSSENVKNRSFFKSHVHHRGKQVHSKRLQLVRYESVQLL